MEFTAGGGGRAGSKGATLGWMTLGAIVLNVCTLDVTIGSRLAFSVKGLKGLVIGTGAMTGLEIGTGAMKGLEIGTGAMTGLEIGTGAMKGLEIGTGAMTGLAMDTTGLAMGAATGGTGAG